MDRFTVTPPPAVALLRPLQRTYSLHAESHAEAVRIIAERLGYSLDDTEALDRWHCRKSGTVTPKPKKTPVTDRLPSGGARRDVVWVRAAFRKYWRNEYAGPHYDKCAKAQAFAFFVDSLHRQRIISKKVANNATL